MKMAPQYLLQLPRLEPKARREPAPATYFQLIFLVQLEDRYTLLGRLSQHRN